MRTVFSRDLLFTMVAYLPDSAKSVTLQLVLFGGMEGYSSSMLCRSASSRACSPGEGLACAYSCRNCSRRSMSVKWRQAACSRSPGFMSSGLLLLSRAVMRPSSTFSHWLTRRRASCWHSCSFWGMVDIVRGSPCVNDDLVMDERVENVARVDHEFYRARSAI